MGDELQTTDLYPEAGNRCSLDGIYRNFYTVFLFGLGERLFLNFILLLLSLKIKFATASFQFSARVTALKPTV